MEILRSLLNFLLSLVFIFVPQDSYTEGLVGQPRSFLPNELQSENDKTISKLIFRGLFKYDREGNIVEDLADSVDISDDGLSYTVFLKKDQRWTNGAEITADDLLYSAFTSDALKEIATDKIDKYTIRYTLPNKFSPFLNLLTQGVTPVIPSNSKLSPVSSGPYRVVRVKKEGPIVKEVSLQSIDSNYKIGRISFRYYENEDQLFTSFKLGEIEGFVSDKEHTWANVNRKDYFQRGIYYSLIFNTRNPKLSGEVRQKLLKATPSNEISSTRGLVAKGPISESPYTSDQLNFNSYDPALKDNLNLNVTLTYPESYDHTETVTKISDAWKNLGVNVTLRPLFVEQIDSEVIPNRNFEILFYGQEVSKDPDRYVLWHSTRTDHPGLNLSGFENVRLDRSLEEGRNTIDSEERYRHYEIFQTVVLENDPAIFLYHPVLKYYTSKRIQITEDPGIYYRYERFSDLKNWKML